MAAAAASNGLTPAHQAALNGHVDVLLVFRWPRHALLSVTLHLLLVVVSLAALLASPAPGWARTSGAAGVVAALLAYAYWMHSVLRFTPR